MYSGTRAREAGLLRHNRLRLIRRRRLASWGVGIPTKVVVRELSCQTAFNVIKIMNVKVRFCADNGLCLTVIRASDIYRFLHTTQIIEVWIIYTQLSSLLLFHTILGNWLVVYAQLIVLELGQTVDYETKFFLSRFGPNLGGAGTKTEDEVAF